MCTFCFSLLKVDFSSVPTLLPTSSFSEGERHVYTCSVSVQSVSLAEGGGVGRFSLPKMILHHHSEGNSLTLGNLHCWVASPVQLIQDHCRRFRIVLCCLDGLCCPVRTGVI